MSAIRNSLNRSEARKKRSTPYSRGFIGTISRIFNYFTGNPTEQSTEPDDEDNNRRINRTHPSERQTFIPIPKFDVSSGNRAPLTPRNGSALPESSTQLVPNAEQVASYFSQRMGANVTTNEVESMISNLQTTPERERFKFTFTTPGPISPPSFSASHVSPTAPPSSSPSKKLAKNPNGVYRWEGGGSAKTPRQRNRFASPAFGASPLKTGRPTTQESAERPRVSGQDAKRRKVDGASVSDPSPTPTSNGVPFPNMTPSTPRTNGVLRQTSPLPSRLRTPAKQTAPFNPSPLRQAWSDASSTSSHEDNKPSPTKPTNAANLVAELIKETAPANKPDLSNPYQTASPVGKVGPPRRATKRPRVVGRLPLPTKDQKAEEQKRKEEEEKLKALSAQAIIEATLPKGSKRSRPPAHLENKPAGDAPRSPSPTSHMHTSSVPTEIVIYTVEEVEDSRPEKRSRSSSEDSSQTKELLADVTVEVLEDVDMDKEKDRDPLKHTSQSSRSTQFQSFKPSSIPREPSKLRFSFQAESSSSSPTPISTPIHLPPLSSEDQPPSVSAVVPTSIQVVSNGFNSSFKNSLTTPKETETESESTVRETTNSSDAETVKAQVRALDIKALPTFKFPLAGSTTFSGTPEHVNARDAAKVVHVSSLPSFSFPPKNTSSLDPANPKRTSSLPVKDSSSGFKPITAPTTPSSNIFGTLPSKTSPAPTAAPTPFKSFDFAAAGMRPPSVTKDTWNCSHCGLSSPQDAIKCTVCDEPKLGDTISTPRRTAPPSFTAVAPVAQPVKSFDWASAGLKAPTASKDAWDCGVCGLSNPKPATKCTICDEPKRGSTILTPPAAPTPFPAVTPEVQPVKTFDWARAGFKAPTASKDTWECGECGLSNPISAAKCTICDHDPHGIASSTTGPTTLAKQAVSSSNVLEQPVHSSSAKGFDVEGAPSEPDASRP